MLQKSITIKAETIEEAIQTALNILQCSIDDINVQVVQPASKSLFGLRKQLAVVSITKVTNSIPVDKDLSKSTNDELESSIDEFLDSPGVESKSDALSKPIEQKNKSESLVNAQIYGAWIQNSHVIIQENEHRFPIIEAGKNVNVLVNGEKIDKPQLVTSKHQIIVELSSEVIPPSFWIEIKDNDMIATLSIKPGKNIVRVLEDTEPEEHLVIEAKEIVTSFSDIQFEDVIHRLKLLKIEYGIIYPAIQEMLSRGEGEMIIAKGVSPVEGLDGDIEILIDGWEGNIEEDVATNLLDKIDYREGQSVLAVELGGIIAKKIASIPGSPGKDLFERVVAPKPVYDVLVKLGKHVEAIDSHIVALSAGRPYIEVRGKFVTISVIKSLRHTGDVSLESGNIRFPGDIWITGNVLDSMVVEAEGKVHINGTINRATIQSGHSMKINQNVFSSELSVGKVNYVIASLIHILTELLRVLDHILAAIDQIMMIRRQKSKEEPIKLSYLIRLLLEKKYSDFTELVSKFNILIDENKGTLDEEWKSLSIKLEAYFLTVSRNQNIQIQTLVLFVESMREIYAKYSIQPEPRVEMELPYAINSTLYSSGNIKVNGQGVYHCSIQADHNVIVKGVCRGGIITAGNETHLEEVGSKNGGKITIRVPANGKIYIKYAHADTVIQVGKRMYMFRQGKANIVASLNGEGNLQL